MSFSFKSSLRTGVALGAFLAITSSAFAGAFAIREQSAEDLGDAFSGAATSGGSLSSMFWNPATMTSHKGWNSTMAATAILPYASIHGSTPSPFSPNKNSGDIGLAALVPASNMSYQINDSLWAGLSINSPFGLATRADHIWTGSLYGQSSAVRSINIRPTIAYKINEMFSVGFGLDIQRFSIRLTSQDPGVPATLDTLAGNSWGVGFTTGVTIKPAQGTEIGIGYRSQMRQNLSGSLQSLALAGKLLYGPLAVGAPVKANVTLPDQINIGIRQKITDDFTLTAGYEWTHWSLFKSFPVTIKANGISPTALAFNYRNGWLASIGGEYKVMPNLTLRAGLGYEYSPISDAVRSVRLPDNNRIWTTAGLSYVLDKKLSFDASYAHIFPASTKIAIVPGNPGFNPAVPVPFLGTANSHIDIVSVGLNYRWDDATSLEAAPAKKGVYKK